MASSSIRCCFGALGQSNKKQSFQLSPIFHQHHIVEIIQNCIMRAKLLSSYLNARDENSTQFSLSKKLEEP